MNLRPEQLITVLMKELFVHRRLISILFIIICSVLVSIGYVWPKKYTSATTVLIDEKNIIQPLMQGAAISTEIADRAKLAREIIFGRKIMDQVVMDIDWGPLPDAEVKTAQLLDKIIKPLLDHNWGISSEKAVEHERLIESITKHTQINNVGKSIIKVEYSDSNPNRAFNVTKKFADLFISEARLTKSAESRAAFEFIEKQVNEYHDKLAIVEEKLKVFKISNLQSQGTDVEVNVRLNALQTRIEQTTQELREAEVKKQSLGKQLSGEAENAIVLSREGQYRARIAGLQAQLDTLRLSYNDTYPDVIRIRHQIDDLNKTISETRTAEKLREFNTRPEIVESSLENTSYNRLRGELSQTQVQLDTLTSRLNESRIQLNADLERGKQVHRTEAEIAELTRDYQVNRSIYEDLLKRRENARVSMNMDKENQGLNFKIQEPATLPLSASGLRFLHFVLAAGCLGIGVPLGLVFLKVQVDQRIRHPILVIEGSKLSVLASVPHLWSPQEAKSARNGLAIMTIAMILTVIVIAAISILRLQKVL